MKNKKLRQRPCIRLEGENGLVVYPKMKKTADGGYEIAKPDAVKRLLNLNVNGKSLLDGNFKL